MRIIASVLSYGLCLASAATAAAQERPKPDTAALTWEPPPKAPKSPKKPAGKQPADRRKIEEWGADRVMGGHAFPFATFVDTPFAASYLGVTGGLEYHLVPRVSKPIAFLGDARTERVDLQTLNVAETVEFELRLHDSYALFGSAYGRARVGVNTPTLLGNGGDYRYGGNVGALLRVLRIDAFQLALRGQGGYYAGQQAGILGLFRDLGSIVNDAFVRLSANPTLDIASTLALVNMGFQSATAELLTPFYGFRYGGSVNAAQALGRYVGVQLAIGASGEIAFFNPRVYDAPSGGTVVLEQRSDTVAGRGAIALDVDGAPAGFAVDLMAEYALTLASVTTTAPNESSSNASTEHLLAIGAYYSGRPDLQLGGTVYTLLGQMPLVAADRSLSGKPQDAGVLLVFRYIW